MRSLKEFLRSAAGLILCLSCSTAEAADDRFTAATESGVLFARNSLIDARQESLGSLVHAPGVVYRRHKSEAGVLAASFSVLGFACLVRGDAVEQGDDAVSAMLGSLVVAFGSLGKQDGDCFVAAVIASDGLLSPVVHDVQATGGKAWLLRPTGDPAAFLTLAIERVEPLKFGKDSWEIWSSAAFRSLIPEASGLSNIHSISREGVAFSRSDGAVGLVLNRNSGPLALSICIPNEPSSMSGDYQRIAKLGAIEIARLLFASGRNDGDVDPLAYFACSQGG